VEPASRPKFRQSALNGSPPNRAASSFAAAVLARHLTLELRTETPMLGHRLSSDKLLARSNLRASRLTSPKG